MSKRKVARALIIFGIGLLAAGIAAVQFFGHSGMGGSELFIVWVLIQSWR